MSINVNLVVYAGRLGRDPVTKTVGSSSVTEFSMVCDMFAGTGKDKKPCWIEVFMWGARGEVLERNLRKGDQLHITGQLDQQSWEKSGEKRSTIKVKINDFSFVGGASSEDKPATPHKEGAPF